MEINIGDSIQRLLFLFNSIKSECDVHYRSSSKRLDGNNVHSLT